MRGFERLCTFGLVVVGVTRIGVVADTTSPVSCTTDLWTINHEGQTPCQVAAALSGACFDNSWTIGPLPAGQKYSGPLLGQSNKCQCSTVTFSVVAACGACQGGSVSTWPDWIQNCTGSDITVGAYPLRIPQGTNVPAWAYLDVTVAGNVWDPTAALAVANTNASETTAGSPPATSVTSSATSRTAPGSPAQTSSSTTTKSSSSSNAGAIAGGVVGGVVGLALLGFVGFFLYRRRHPRGSKSGAPHNGEKLDLVGGTTPAPMYADGFQSPPLPMQQEPPRLYDPSDPSTFPTTPSQSPFSPGYSDHLNGPPGYASPAPPHHFISPPGTGIGGYSGAPEV